ncbi:carboxylating nicotinate-nucleotide diphosphorylase [Oligella ureolytica]
MIKDNHIAVAGSLTTAVERARATVGHLVKIEVEVDTLEQLDEALAIGVDVVLLDNMSLEQLAEAVRRIDGRAISEASGGVTPETAVKIAQQGVNQIAIGGITHSAPILDIGLDVI